MKKELQLEKKPFLEQLGLTRVLAILAVLIVHSTSKVEVMLSKEATLYPFYNFWNTFFKIGTTTFIFLSAFVLFYSYSNREFTFKSLKNFYIKRLKFIIIPYILFSIFYFVFPRYFSGRLWSSDWSTVKLFLQQLMEGKAYAHLYFVFVNVQFYLLFPLLLWLFKKYPRLIKHTIWIGFVLQWAYIFLNMYYIKYPYKASVSFSYFSHYFLGIFAAFYFDSFMQFLRSKWKYLIIVSWIVFSSIQAVFWVHQRMGTAKYHLRLLDLMWNLQTWFAAIVLLIASFWLYDKLGPKLRYWLLHLGACSFGVYLIHPFLLYLFRRYTDTTDGFWYQMTLPAAFLVALFGSWLLVSLIRRLPGSWAIIGNIQMPQKTEKISIPVSTTVDKSV